MSPLMVLAHPYSASFTTVTFSPEETTLTFSIDSVSVMELLEFESRSGNLNEEIIVKEGARIAEIISEHLVLEVNHRDLSAQLDGIIIEDKREKQFATFTFHYPPFDAGAIIQLHDGLYVNDPNTNYMNLVAIIHGEQTSETILQGKERTWTYLMTEIQGEQVEAVQMISTTQSPSWLSFFKLGMEHIITGYDHLLFLFALLLRKQTFKQYAAIITSFTVAHSITLSLAVLGWVDLPSRFIEAVIAISICYIALENIFRKQIRNRWALTFIFGLIHGMGFASILKDMTIPKSHLTVSLISFNIGIEVIQLSLVLLLLPVLAWMQRLRFSRSIVLSGSSGIVILGGIWLVERIFL